MLARRRIEELRKDDMQEVGIALLHELADTAIAALDLLKKLEYIQEKGHIGNAIFRFCPVCEAPHTRNHKPTCKLGKLLNESEGDGHADKV